MPTSSPRRTRCGACGNSFPIGWGILNHQQTSPCSRLLTVEGTPDDAVADNGGDLAVTFTSNEYMEILAERGTLDPHFLHKYASWGPRGVDPIVAKCARFLRCTEVGSGSSRRHAQTFLDYTKSIGGRAHILPRTVEGCWKMMEKVTFQTFIVTFHYYCITFVIVMVTSHYMNVPCHIFIATFQYYFITFVIVIVTSHYNNVTVANSTFTSLY